MKIIKSVILTKTDIKEIIAERFKLDVSYVELRVSTEPQHGDTFIDAEVMLPENYDLTVIQ